MVPVLRSTSCRFRSGCAAANRAAMVLIKYAAYFAVLGLAMLNVGDAQLGFNETCTTVPEDTVRISFI